MSEIFHTNCEAACYLAAMIDGEGTVGKIEYKCVRIANTDIGIIRACEAASKMLQLSYHLKKVHARSSGYKDIYIMEFFGQDNLRRLCESVILQCLSKRQRLNQILASYKKSMCPGPVILKSLYFKDKRSLYDIATKFNCSAATVHSWFKKFGIRRRTIKRALAIIRSY